MRATVIADASWCPQTHAAGWACWIAGDGFKSKGFSGPVHKLCDSSNEAELQAVAIGVGLAHQLYGATNILVQSDCTHVEKHFRPLCPPGLTLRYKHVKGHTTIKDSRSWANRWCDREAKNNMRYLRALLHKL